MILSSSDIARICAASSGLSKFPESTFADFIFNKFNDREILEISHDEFTELNQSIILFSDFKENKKKIIKIAKFKKFPLIIFSFIKLWYILNFIKKKKLFIFTKFRLFFSLSKYFFQ